MILAHVLNAHNTFISFTEKFLQRFEVDRRHSKAFYFELHFYKINNLHFYEYKYVFEDWESIDNALELMAWNVKNDSIRKESLFYFIRAPVLNGPLCAHEPIQPRIHILQCHF